MCAENDHLVLALRAGLEFVSALIPVAILDLPPVAPDLHILAAIPHTPGPHLDHHHHPTPVPLPVALVQEGGDHTLLHLVDQGLTLGHLEGAG